MGHEPGGPYQVAHGSGMPPLLQFTLRRLALAVAVAAIGFGTLRSAIPYMIPGYDSSPFVDLYALVLILAVGIDCIIQSRGHLPFWWGFVIAGTAYITLAIIFYNETTV